MRRLWPVLLAAALLSGCSEGSTQLVTAPSDPIGPPASLKLTAMQGAGMDSASVYLSANVTDAKGKPCAVAVSFVTTAGAINPSTVTADAGGLAQTKLTGNGKATVTASAGSAVAQIDVSPSQPSTGTPTPNNPPTPQPDPDFKLSSLSAQAVTIGTSSIIQASLIGAVYPLSASWTFGDGSTLSNGTYAASHTYAAAGNYSVSVAITDGKGRTVRGSTTAVVNALPPPPAAPPAPDPNVWSVSLTCSAAPFVAPPTGGIASCNVTANDGTGVLVPSQSIGTTWDWGDGVPLANISAPVAQHVYLQTGVYTVRVTATNGTGKGSATQSVTIK